MRADRRTPRLASRSILLYTQTMSTAKELNSQYRIIRAATVYALTGSMIATSEQCNQSVGSIHAYSKLPLFQEHFEKIRKEKILEIQARLSHIVDLSSRALADRIENGDEYVSKDGSIQRKSMSGKDIAIVMGITIQRGMELAGTAIQD